MKITCQACQAKYTIADEKVVGKVVKIRCKKCGATIVVNGNQQGQGASPEAGAADAGANPAAEPWTVNVAEGDQRTMTEAEVLTAYRSGVVSDETFCWREGMADWLPIGEIAALHAACVAAGPPIALSGDGDDSPTRIQDASLALGGAPIASGPPAPRPKTLPPSRDGNGAHGSLAARRSGGRAPDNDLFSSAAKAGGEEEVLTSLPGDRIAGGRAEKNTLFGMGPAANNGPGAQASKMPATSEASGLIDIRQLSAAKTRSTPPDDKKKKERVDDIMNLGGGAFGPTLAAPVLAAPTLEHISSKPPPSALASINPDQGKNRLIVLTLALAGLACLLGAGALIAFVFYKPAAEAERASSAQVTTPAASTSAASTAKGASSAAVAPSDTAAAAPSESASAAPAASAKEPPKETPAPREAPVAQAPKPAAAPPPPAPVGAPATEFNMGEAKARLAAIAGNVQSCKRGDTTGSGRVEIVFAPSGGVQSASLIPGSPFDGTVTAKCVEARFRGARVPAFGGGPFSVTKGFSIN
ncbi:MAG: zinc-ribbon domain-containing protein [Myxococcales bacterium]|nr:zinc-ribbon domain-containing protein [Myxococcales bacterium]